MVAPGLADRVDPGFAGQQLLDLSHGADRQAQVMIIARAAERDQRADQRREAPDGQDGLPLLLLIALALAPLGLSGRWWRLREDRAGDRAASGRRAEGEALARVGALVEPAERAEQALLG